ncbi:MAG: hypothetical protein IBX63_09635 [Coriobacteriia bacterium]|nr:hypothetical protein [Coriobacteriia bacterium]
MMRNSDISDNTLLEQGIEELRTRLPQAWRVDVLARESYVPGPDALLRIAAPGGSVATLAVEIKRRLDPKDVESLVLRTEMRRFEGKDVKPVVVARFLGERTRERLRALGAGYVDLTGNMYLRLDLPAVAIERTGAARDPEPSQRPARSLKGAKAGRVVRTLVDYVPPLGTREIARIADVDAGYVSRLLAMLEREDLIDRKPRGPVVRTDWMNLLRAWAKDYSLTGTNIATSYVQPRGLPALLDALRELPSGTDGEYAITGSLAAARWSPVAPARLGVVYLPRPGRVAERFGLTPADVGANVLLVEPADKVVFERTVTDEGLVYAAPSQVAVDLLTSSGRAPEEAEALIEWMLRNESVWRA